MELRVLKYFLVVAREENITKAASLLHVTQPTLSRQLMQLEEELLDLGLLAEPVDIGRYAFIRMPKRDRWGIWIRYDDPLAQKETAGPGDLVGVPLLVSRRELVQKELAAWFGDSYEKLEIAATYNLILNAVNMV